MVSDVLLAWLELNYAEKIRIEMHSSILFRHHQEMPQNANDTRVNDHYDCFYSLVHILHD